MNEPLTSPTRQQLYNMANGDERLVRQFELLFSRAGVDAPAAADELASEIRNRPFNYSSAFGLQQSVQSLSSGEFVFVSGAADLPRPADGVITLEDGVTYFITSEIDLAGDRIISGRGTVLIGGSSENSAITSTGLSGPLITSQWSISLRFITLEADNILSLDPGATPDQAIDWIGVNFRNSPNVGLIANYNNVIISDSAFLNATGLVFDGVIGTIGFSNTLFAGQPTGTNVTIADTANITRRFRIIYSAVVALGTSTAIDVSVLASIPDEGYILDTVNFSGPGTYLSGVQLNDNRPLFVNNKGIINSANFANYYMTNNATPTPVTSGVPTKALGTTTANPINQKFTHTSNRATYTGALTRDFEVEAWAALTAGNNNVLRLYIAKNGVAITDFFAEGTANAGGRAEGLVTAAVVELSAGDYVEVFLSNETNNSSVTDVHLNVIVSEL